MLQKNKIEMPEPDTSGVRKISVDENVIINRMEKIEKKYKRRLQRYDSEEIIPQSEPGSRSIIRNKENKIIKTKNDEKEEKPMIFFDKSNDVQPDFIPDPADEVDLPESIPEDKTLLREILDWAKHIIIAVALGLILVLFVVQRNEVIGSSMEPNLFGSDQLLVQKVSKLFKGGIAHGDIITIDAQDLLGHTGDKNIIKRVIGIPGDTIEIKNNSVFRNGIKLDEPYLSGVQTMEREKQFSQLTLDENQFYVLGDNRSVSLDSRTFGPIDKSRIIGEVLIRFYPLDSFGKP